MLKLLLIGNLGKDATINLYDGKSVINFSVAHTEKYKDKNGNNNSKVVWVECAYWVNSTGIAQYLNKGTSVFVEGVPEINVFEKQDGTTGSSLKLKVTSVQLLGGGNRHNDNAQTATVANDTVSPGKEYNQHTGNIETILSDDLPF